MRQSQAKVDGKAGKAVYAMALAMMLLLARMAAAQEVPSRRILVSIPDRKLALIENGEVVRVYPVAVGAEVSQSPSGEFTIVNRVANPTYYHPHKVIGPGPANPLGSRWIGLSQPHYGIHGTNEPRSIGKGRRTVAFAWRSATWKNCSRWCRWATRWRFARSATRK